MIESILEHEVIIDRMIRTWRQRIKNTLSIEIPFEFTAYKSSRTTLGDQFLRVSKENDDVDTAVFRQNCTGIATSISIYKIKIKSSEKPCVKLNYYKYICDTIFYRG